MKVKFSTPKKIGRPPMKAKDKRTYTYLIRLSSREKKVLKSMSREQQQNPSVLFRSILQPYLNATA